MSQPVNGLVLCHDEHAASANNEGTVLGGLTEHESSPAGRTDEARALRDAPQKVMTDDENQTGENQ